MFRLPHCCYTVSDTTNCFNRSPTRPAAQRNASRFCVRVSRPRMWRNAQQLRRCNGTARCCGECVMDGPKVDVSASTGWRRESAVRRRGGIRRITHWEAVASAGVGTSGECCWIACHHLDVMDLFDFTPLLAAGVDKNELQHLRLLAFYLSIICLSSHDNSPPLNLDDIDFNRPANRHSTRPLFP